MTPSCISRDFNGLNRRSRVPSEISNPLVLSLVLLLQAVRVISCDSLIFASFSLHGFLCVFGNRIQHINGRVKAFCVRFMSI